MFRDANGDTWEEVVNNAQPMTVEVGNGGYDEGFGDDEGFGASDDELAAIVSADIAFGADDEAAAHYLEGELGRIQNPRKRARVAKRLGKRQRNIERKLNKKVGPTSQPGDNVPRIPATVIIKYTLTVSGAWNTTKQVPHDFDITGAVAEAPSGTAFTLLKSGDRSPLADTPEGMPASLMTSASTVKWLETGRIGRNDVVRLEGTATASSGDVKLILSGTKPAVSC